MGLKINKNGNEIEIITIYDWIFESFDTALGQVCIWVIFAMLVLYSEYIMGRYAIFHMSKYFPNIQDILSKQFFDAPGVFVIIIGTYMALCVMAWHNFLGRLAFLMSTISTGLSFGVIFLAVDMKGLIVSMIIGLVLGVAVYFLSKTRDEIIITGWWHFFVGIAITAIFFYGTCLYFLDSVYEVKYDLGVGEGVLEVYYKYGDIVFIATIIFVILVVAFYFIDINLKIKIPVTAVLSVMVCLFIIISFNSIIKKYDTESNELAVEPRFSFYQSFGGTTQLSEDVSDNISENHIINETSGESGMIQISVKSANIRSGAGKSYGVIGNGKKGDKYVLTDSEANGKWHEIYLDEAKQSTGWINEAVFERIEAEE